MSSPETDPAPQGESAEEQEKPKLKLTLDVDKTHACGRHVTVTIDRDDIERYFGDAFDEMMPTAQVPGFRPGRAPRKLVESKFRRDLSDQVKGSLLMDCLSQVTEDEDFSAISEPDFDFDAVELPDEGPMTFEFDVEVRPEFEIPQWKGIKVERPVYDFGAADIDAHLETLLIRSAELNPREGAAEAGDYLTVDVQFTRDGEEVALLEDESIRIKPTLSFADGTLEGFDKLMVGAEAGQTKTASIELTDDTPNEALRGQQVEAQFTIRDIQWMKPPPIDEEFLQELGFSTEGDLRDAVKADLQRQLVYHQQQSIREQISALLTESADWELPQDLLRRQGSRELERAILELKSSGFTDEDIRRYENEIRQNSAARTAAALKEHFILEAIAEQEDIEADPGDYDQEIARIAAQSNESPRRVRARLEKRDMMDALRNQIVERKVIEMISGHADYMDVETPPEERDVQAVDFFIGGDDPAEAIPEAQHEEGPEALSQPADRS